MKNLMMKFNNMANESGTYNYVVRKDSIKNIELYTKRFKTGRMSTEEYITLMHENLQKLSSKRDYVAYLMNIGQLNN
jgi:hypothetical protein